MPTARTSRPPATTWSRCRWPWGVLAPIGFVMPMAVGAILMSLSTVVVAHSAQFLRRLDLRPGSSAIALRSRASGSWLRESA